MGVAANNGRVCELTARLVAHGTFSCYNPGVGPSITSTDIGQIGQDAILSPSYYLEVASTISNLAPDSPRCKFRYQQVSCPTDQGPFSFHLKLIPLHTLWCIKLVGYCLDVPASRL